ncbi:MAG: hypothetical protein AAF495_05925 [Pseudomonadota bacterium]
MSFWDPEKRSAYLAKTAQKSEDLRRHREGDAIARDLARLWPELEESERDLLRALVATGRKSFIAKHDLPLLRGLLAKDLLRYPRGQGGNWMRAARTSYAVAPAAWQALQDLDGARTTDPATAETLLREVTSS